MTEADWNRLRPLQGFQQRPRRSQRVDVPTRLVDLRRGPTFRHRRSHRRTRRLAQPTRPDQAQAQARPNLVACIEFLRKTAEKPRPEWQLPEDLDPTKWLSDVDAADWPIQNGKP